jgi:hypothetical protein
MIATTIISSINVKPASMAGLGENVFDFIVDLSSAVKVIILVGSEA